MTASRRAIRGEVVSFLDDPRRSANFLRHIPDGIVLIEDGRIIAVEPVDCIRGLDVPLDDCRGHLVLPGFIDAHLHLPQLDIVASPGENLLGWLERYTFPAEARFSDPKHAADSAGFLLDEMLRNGVTCGAVYGSVHAQPLDALFAAAKQREMSIVAGKVLMDRLCPPQLRDGPDGGLDACRTQIRRWHGQGRLRYAVTPRFALTSTREQLAAAGRLLDEFPGVLMQTHISENRKEIDSVHALYPETQDYLEVYEQAGLIREGAVLGHGVWLSERERNRLAEAGAAVAFCPSSNAFLGSGAFSYSEASASGVTVGLASDVGAGPTLCPLDTMREAYFTARRLDENFSAFDAFYLATLGSARALRLSGSIGALGPGMDADILIIDPAATPVMARRQATARDIEERLFALMMLGDDRSVVAVYVRGDPGYHASLRKSVN